MTGEPDRTHLRPGLRVVIAGTVGRTRAIGTYYEGVGNRFWELLHAGGIVGERLDAGQVARLPLLGVGVTDLVLQRVHRAGREPETVIHRDPFDRAIRDTAPRAVAFVSKTAATWYARGAGHRLPHRYGETGWGVAGVPGFVLPGPSGANNAMSVPLRTTLWADLADFLEHLEGDG